MDAEVERLREDLWALEEKAGIRAAAEDAALGPMIPLGIHEEATPDEYFADVDRHHRRKLRKLYFGVQDHQLRQELIIKSSEIDRAIDDAARQESARAVRDATKDVAEARKRLISLPWGPVGIAGAVTVIVGNAIVGLPGAIGGAVLAFFSGQGYIARARAAAELELRNAESELDIVTKEHHDPDRRTEPFFTLGEILSGTEDRNA